MLATNMSAWAQDVFRKMSYSPKQTVFYLNSPKRPTLSLWSEGLGGQPLRTVKMRADGKNRWKATVKGDLKGQFYTFNIGRGDTPGVFAKAVGVNGQRGAIIDLRQTDPEGWATSSSTRCTTATSPSPATLPIRVSFWHCQSLGRWTISRASASTPCIFCRRLTSPLSTRPNSTNHSTIGATTH